MTSSPGPFVARPPWIGIVDDDDDVRRALRRLLIASGFAVAAFESGEAFLASLPSPHALDCLILDVHLGGMSGLELYQLLRQRAIAPPVVFITAHSELLDDVEWVDTPCLQKPFDSEALIEAIAQARRAA